ncbi:hypothetical protein J504_1416 [Acinetobacter baumannii 348935]|nr:hypothetical protein J504_1416 [Acinetobacter baumannii 348935]
MFSRLFRFANHSGIETFIRIDFQWAEPPRFYIFAIRVN